MKPAETGLAARVIPTAGTGSTMGGITLAGQLQASAGIGHGNMRVLGSYAVVYLLAGGGEFGDASGLRREVRAGDLLLLFPEVPHFYGPRPGGRWDEIYFVFHGPVFDQWRQAGLLSPREPVWHAEPVAAWHRRLAAVCAGRGGGTAESLLELARLQAVLAELWQMQRPAGVPAAGEPDWLPEVCRELEAPGGGPDWAALAARAGLSYERFRKKFAALKGVPPARYRQQRLMDRACVLLAEDGRPLKDIAAELGLCDEFHFSKLFKQRTGLAPSAYRQQMRRGQP
ncbi:MAG: helix-turn-helix transcriptional regulator [Opitutaceae bacterium]|nr:helix-turn-helix transcriptional regulator [Opitutaceae bacterium]